MDVEELAFCDHVIYTQPKVIDTWQTPLTVVSEGIDFVGIPGDNQGSSLGNAVFVGFVVMLEAFRSKVAFLMNFGASKTDCLQSLHFLQGIDFPPQLFNLRLQVTILVFYAAFAVFPGFRSGWVAAGLVQE